MIANKQLNMPEENNTNNNYNSQYEYVWINSLEIHARRIKFFCLN